MQVRSENPPGSRGLKERLRARLSRQGEHLLSSMLDAVDWLGGTAPLSPDRARDVKDERSLRTGIAIVGCGFVADSYGRTLALHPELELIGVVDRDRARAARFASRHGVDRYPSLAALLADPRVEVVVNLTNPGSHFAVSKTSLEAGKHVYSEKPLAMVAAEAEELVAIAETRGLILSSAPCSVLGESAQTLGQVLRRGDIGQVRIVYAELDDGPIHQMHPEEWASPQGTPWPWRASSRSAARWNTPATT